MIIKLFQAEHKLGQGARAAKTQAIENLYVSKGAKTKSYKDNTKLRNDLDERQLHKSFRKPPQYSKANFRSKDNIWNADLIIVSKP